MSWEYENCSEAQRMERLLFSNLTPQMTISTSFVNVMKDTDGTVKMRNMEPGEKVSIGKV